MKIKFIGVPGEDHQSITQYGHDFRLDKYVDVKDLFAIRKLSAHPHFSAINDVTDVEDNELASPYAELLSGSVSEIAPVLASFSDEELEAIVAEESDGKARKGVLSAIEEIQESRKA